MSPSRSPGSQKARLSTTGEKDRPNFAPAGTGTATGTGQSVRKNVPEATVFGGLNSRRSD